MPDRFWPYCKHVRGATGFGFWHDLHALLRDVDSQLGLWCALEMGVDARALARLTEPARLDAAELGGAIKEAEYNAFAA